MGKHNKSVYNDFLDGEKLRDNAYVRTSLQQTTPPDHTISPPQSNSNFQRRAQNPKGASKKPPLTHFLCLPLVTPTSRPQLEASLSHLKSDLTTTPIPPAALRPASSLHLTLGVMSLSAPELTTALAHLAALDIHALLSSITAQTIAERAAENGTVSENLSASQMPDAGALSVQLKGLVPMQSAHRTSILYAEPKQEPGEETLRLQMLGERLKREFERGGWLVEDRRGLRLHATVVNTIYARGRRGRGGGRGEDGMRRGQRDGKVDGKMDGTVDGVVEGAGKDGEDGESTAGETIDGDDEPTTAPPDPSTVETKVGREDGPAHGAGHGHGRGGGKKKAERKEVMRFDARELVERYKDFVWAENVRIDRVQICKMGAKKIFNESGEVVDEEYEVVGEKIIAAS